MSRLPLLLLIVTELMRARTAVVTYNHTLTDKLERLYEKLERMNVAPTESLSEKIASKIDKLNSLNINNFDDGLTDEDEELLTAMQMWAEMSPDQLGGVAKELQQLRIDGDDLKNDKFESDYSDDGWSDDDMAYAMDDWDSDEDLDSGLGSTARPMLANPQPIFRHESFEFRSPVVAIDPIAATNERPRILDEPLMTQAERSALRTAVLDNMRHVIKAGRCLTPQPRWLAVRQLAPAADIVYMPPCVQLHRCAPDSGCCNSEAEVCAPTEGRYIAMPFYLHNADGNFNVTRMLFYNHTKCACIPRETLQRKAELRLDIDDGLRLNDKEIDWQQPTEEPRLEKDEELTAPPQLRRCTCPTLFKARMQDGLCTCVCDWPDTNQKRDCLSLSRGREHFGLRDRVCIANGDCTSPSCEYGTYGKSLGKCPLRKFRRVRYHGRGKFLSDRVY